MSELPITMTQVQLPATLLGDGLSKSLERTIEQVIGPARQMQETINKLCLPYREMQRTMDAVREQMKIISPAMTEALRQAQKYREMRDTIIKQSTFTLPKSIAVVPRPMEHTPVRYVPYDEEMEDRITMRVVERLESRQPTEIELCLDLVHGELFDFSPNQVSHTFSDREAGRIKILERLVDHGTYVTTTTLRESTEYKSEDSLRKAIQAVNAFVQNKMGLPQKLIVGSRGRGYRINPRYNVTLKH